MGAVHEDQRRLAAIEEEMTLADLTLQILLPFEDESFPAEAEPGMSLAYLAAKLQAAPGREASR